MWTTCILLAAALAAPADTALYGTLPQDATSFELTVNGESLGPVILQVSGDWWRGDAESLPAAGVLYYPDAPWQASQMERLPRGAELVAELPYKRKTRLEKGWKDAGYTFIETAGGVFPVREADKALAAKAVADAAAIERQSDPRNLVIASAGATPAAAEGDASTGGAMGYLGHLIVVVVALVVGAVIVKALILGEDDSWERVG